MVVKIPLGPTRDLWRISQEACCLQSTGSLAQPASPVNGEGGMRINCIMTEDIYRKLLLSIYVSTVQISSDLLKPIGSSARAAISRTILKCWSIILRTTKFQHFNQSIQFNLLQQKPTKHYSAIPKASRLK